MTIRGAHASAVAVLATILLFTSAQLTAITAHADGATGSGSTGSASLPSPGSGVSRDVDAISRAAARYNSTSPSSIAELADAASTVSAVGMERDGSGLAASGARGLRVAVSKDGRLALSMPGMPEIGVRVVGDTGGAALVGGVWVQGRVARSTGVVTRATDDGAQLVAVLGDRNAQSVILFSIDLPKGYGLVKEADGSISVTAPVAVKVPKPGELRRLQTEVAAILRENDGSGGRLSDEQVSALSRVKPMSTVTQMLVQRVAVVDQPWAVDADGNAVGTRFEIEGNTIRQVMDLGQEVVFPVTADPRIRTAWYGTSVDFSKSETKKISRSMNDCATIFGLGTALAAASEAGAPLAVVTGIITAGCGAYGRVADKAVADKKCLSFKWVWGVNIPIPWESKCYK